MKPLSELRNYLRRFGARCRAMRWLGALFHVRVVEHIASDLETSHRRIGQAAYTNEQAQLGLAAEIREMLADGIIDRDELGRLRLAPKTLNRCAERSHAIAEATV